MLSEDLCEQCLFNTNLAKCLFCNTHSTKFILSECGHKFCKDCMHILKSFKYTKDQFFYKSPIKCSYCSNDAVIESQDINNNQIFLCKNHHNSAHAIYDSFYYESNREFKSGFEELINKSIKKLMKIIKIVSDTKEKIFREINLVVADTIKKCLIEISNLTGLKNKVLIQDEYCKHDYYYIDRLRLLNSTMYMPSYKPDLNKIKMILSSKIISENYGNYEIIAFDEEDRKLILTNVVTDEIKYLKLGNNCYIDIMSIAVKVSLNIFFILAGFLNSCNNRAYYLDTTNMTIKEVSLPPFKLQYAGLTHQNEWAYVFSPEPNSFKFSLTSNTFHKISSFTNNPTKISATLHREKIYVASDSIPEILIYLPAKDHYKILFTTEVGPKQFTSSSLIVNNKIYDLSSRQAIISSSLRHQPPLSVNLTESIELNDSIFICTPDGFLASYSKETFSLTQQKKLF